MAKVIYVTATVGSDASHMWYMDRLMLWGRGCPFSSVGEFEEKISKWYKYFFRF